MKICLSKKIFCLGLPRSGTTSLHLALVMHGIPSIHRPLGMAYQMFQGHFQENFLEDYCAFSDLPFPIYHRELKQMYPNSLFILTERNEQEWLTSIEKFLISRPPAGNKTVLRDMLRLAMFGRLTFDESRFRNIFRQHHEDVLENFKSGDSKLLRLNVSNIDAITELFEFVGLAPRIKKFPNLKNPYLGKLSAVKKEEVNAVSQSLLRLYKDSNENFDGIYFS